MLKKIFLFAIAACCIAGNAAAAGFRQKMDVRIGMFDAAAVVLDYEEKNGKFDISAEVKTANLFDTLYPFTGRYMSSGLTGTKGILPTLYQTYTKSRSHTRTKKIYYDANGIAYKRVSTKDKKQSTAAISDVPKSADAADLQTVFAELIKNFGRDKSCALAREIYDGKKYYKVIAKDEGTESRYFDLLKRTENSYKCSIYIENLKNNNDNILWEVSAEKPIYLWVGVDGKAKLPYVLEIGIDSTPLGALKVTPKTLEIK